MKDIKTYTAQNNQGTLLNANENPENLNRKIVKEISEAIAEIDFNRYPDDDMSELKKAYGEYISLSPDQIIVGNGSDEMLGLLINLTLGEGKKLYTMEQDFSMYDYYASMQGAEIVRFPITADDMFDVDEFIRFGKKNDIDMIIFSNPNNPTGRQIKNGSIIKILESFQDIKVVVDEAYAEFCNVNMLPYLDLYPNLLITRTLSKAYGLAGVRCGFLLGNKELIKEIAPYKVPYNVNVLTQLTALITLQYKDLMYAGIERIKSLRDTMYMEYLMNKPQRVTLYPSAANYFYGVCEDKKKLLQVMVENNIVIRNFDGNSFRISVGNEEDNKRVIELLCSL
ncbi:histidinol-phosphate transaminase [Breznakia pachnodae]|uniref:Histidinol-phosphate aminotransferase n=1 Tax=Breznakia pachnodae TaxID=265178 RepID=A0ABU0DY48_9FIRM|nr:histidinol-phosphate transaminase [Breznakia pachnodae]MDQ0359567.1 histidinol-phosphate aminotransferase [Breznakia pachnodae]